MNFLASDIPSTDSEDDDYVPPATTDKPGVLNLHKKRKSFAPNDDDDDDDDDSDDDDLPLEFADGDVDEQARMLKHYEDVKSGAGASSSGAAASSAGAAASSAGAATSSAGAATSSAGGAASSAGAATSSAGGAASSPPARPSSGAGPSSAGAGPARALPSEALPSESLPSEARPSLSNARLSPNIPPSIPPDPARPAGTQLASDGDALAPAPTKPIPAHAPATPATRLPAAAPPAGPPPAAQPPPVAATLAPPPDPDQARPSKIQKLDGDAKPPPQQSAEKKKKPASSIDDIWAEMNASSRRLPQKPREPATDPSLMGWLSQPQKPASSQPFKVKLLGELEEEAKSREAKEAADELSSKAGPSRATGLEAALNIVRGPRKETVLTKTKDVWNEFKGKDDKVVDELEKYKKDKNRYTDKVAFLKRSDVREWEYEQQGKRKRR